jgi:hypothetical protein
MVHALQEIRRALIPNGKLIDLRPLAGGWPVEVASRREQREVARVTDLPRGLEDDAAANQSMAAAAERGWFSREKEQTFPFYYYWDSPSQMQAYVEDEWEDFVGVSEEAWKRIRSEWAMADADARLRVRVKLLITHWGKVNDRSAG